MNVVRKYRLAGGNGIEFTFAILTLHCKQAMTTQGSGFCILPEIVLLYPFTVKTSLSVRCYEQ